MKPVKVFGVGLQKTGTSTLGKVLSILGYKIELDTDYDLVDSLLKGEYDSIRDRVRNFDAFEDNPWPIVYKELDKWYPGSKFILTIRDHDNWIGSITKHFGAKKSDFREWFYGEGAPLSNEELYINRYHEHNEAVKEYFKSRTEDFLIIDFEKGQGWKEICDFLNEPVPNLALPHLNKNKTLLDKLQHKVAGGIKKIKTFLGIN